MDKLYHFIAGLLIALIVGIISPVAGLIAAIIAGAVKEDCDYWRKKMWNEGSGWNWLDLAATVLGGSAGFIIIKLFQEVQ